MIFFHYKYNFIFRLIRKLINLNISIIISFFYLSAAKADWTKVIENSNGQTFYVNMESILEEKGHVFFWELIDYNQKDEYGDLSAKIYIEGDCKNFRFKWLRLSYHKDAMGTDNVKNQQPSKIVADWQHPVRNSISMKVLDYICKNKGVTL